MRRRSRHRTPPEQLLPEDERVWNAFNRRKLVYHHRVFAKHVGANPRSNYRPVTPDAFRQSPARLQRLRPWLRRDLRAVLGEEEDVELLVLFIEGALVRYSMQEQRTVDVLLPYLGDRTEQFIHELVSFARSPFELDTYDRLVQYDWPAEALQVRFVPY
jgi:E3 ubiquitin-protein ligase Topors